MYKKESGNAHSYKQGARSMQDFSTAIYLLPASGTHWKLEVTIPYKWNKSLFYYFSLKDLRSTERISSGFRLIGSKCGDDDDRNADVAF